MELVVDGLHVPSAASIRRGVGWYALTAAGLLSSLYTAACGSPVIAPTATPTASSTAVTTAIFRPPTREPIESLEGATATSTREPSPTRYSTATAAAFSQLELTSESAEATVGPATATPYFTVTATSQPETPTVTPPTPEPIPDYIMSYEEFKSNMDYILGQTNFSASPQKSTVINDTVNYLVYGMVGGDPASEATIFVLPRADWARIAKQLYPPGYSDRGATNISSKDALRNSELTQIIADTYMEIPNSAYFIPVSTGKIGLQVLTLALHERGHVIDRLQPQRFGEVQHVTINGLWPYAFGAEEDAADLYAGAVLRYAAEQLPESGLPNLPDTQRVRNVIKIFQPLGPDEGPFDVNSGSIIRSFGWVMALGDPSLGFADSLLSTGMVDSLVKTRFEEVPAI